MSFDMLVTAGMFIVGQAIAFFVWLVRIEGRVNYSQKQVDALTLKHEALDSKIFEELGRLREGIARIEGYLQTHRNL